MTTRHPLFKCLNSAIRHAIHSGTVLEEIRVDKWGETYHATADEVRAAWTHEMTKIAPNTGEVEGK